MRNIPVSIGANNWIRHHFLSMTKKISVYTAKQVYGTEALAIGHEDGHEVQTLSETISVQRAGEDCNADQSKSAVENVMTIVFAVFFHRVSVRLRCFSSRGRLFVTGSVATIIQE